MQELAGEAHGDLVKPPELLTSFGRDQLRYQLNQLEGYGYLAVKIF